MSSDPGQHFRPPLADQRLPLAECQMSILLGFSGQNIFLILFPFFGSSESETSPASPGTVRMPNCSGFPTIRPTTHAAPGRQAVTSDPVGPAFESRVCRYLKPPPKVRETRHQAAVVSGRCLDGLHMSSTGLPKHRADQLCRKAPKPTHLSSPVKFIGTNTNCPHTRPLTPLPLTDLT